MPLHPGRDRKRTPTPLPRRAAHVPRRWRVGRAHARADRGAYAARHLYGLTVTAAAEVVGQPPSCASGTLCPTGASSSQQARSDCTCAPMGTILRSPSAITASMVLAALLALPQAPADEAVTGASPAVELASSSHKMTPKPPELSEAEKKAIEDRKAGRPVDEDVYNSAMQKIKKREKYDGERRSRHNRGGKRR